MGVTVTVADVNRVMGIAKPRAIRILIGESTRREELIDRIDDIYDDFASSGRSASTRLIGHFWAGAGGAGVPGLFFFPSICARSMAEKKS